MKIATRLVGQEMASPDVLTALESLAKKRSSGRVRNLQVSLRDNGLVLRGLTHTYYAKQLAQHAIMDATTLPIVGNEIEVVS